MESADDGPRLEPGEDPTPTVEDDSDEHINKRLRLERLPRPEDVILPPLEDVELPPLRDEWADTDW